MKRKALTLLLMFVAIVANAQTALEEITENPCLSRGNYVAYRGPLKALTPAPEGYAPCYISHYGRHGSRYLIGEKDYSRPVGVLMKADSAGVLSAEGKALLNDLKLMEQEAQQRHGELTAIGAAQHHGIAGRMYERFPEVFKDSAHVDARSTLVVRCILSMENELLELTRHNPTLKITHDASQHDLYYMNQYDRYIDSMKNVPAVKAAFSRWQKSHIDCEAMIAPWFTNQEYVSKNVNAYQLLENVYSLATILQNSELSKHISLFGFFRPGDIYELWRANNLWWYLHYGPAKESGGVQAFSQRNLLRNIIATADSCLKEKVPGATLRFGHDTMVMPLVCLLNLNGYGNAVDADSLAEKGWADYRIFPMACNVQLIFYRNASKPANDDNTLVKVLLNEDEATLPLKAVSGPYYRWSDFKTYYTRLLNSYDSKKKK